MAITAQEMHDFLCDKPIASEELRQRIYAEMDNPNSALNREIDRIQEVGRKMCNNDCSWMSLEKLFEDWDELEDWNENDNDDTVIE